MNPKILAELIPLADAHREADEYVAGTYGEGGSRKACAIGCTIKDARNLGILPKGTSNGDHAKLAAETGVCETAWRFLDHCFEGLPEAERPALTPRFLRAAKQGTDHGTLAARLSIRCLRKLGQDAIRDDVRAAASATAALWERRRDGDEPREAEWDAARTQTDAARTQTDAARTQTDAARTQAEAAWTQFWRWCADMLCEEAARKNPGRSKR